MKVVEKENENVMLHLKTKTLVQYNSCNFPSDILSKGITFYSKIKAPEFFKTGITSSCSFVRYFRESLSDKNTSFEYMAAFGKFQYFPSIFFCTHWECSRTCP